MSASYKLSDYYKGVTAAIYVGEVAAVLSGKISKQLNNPPSPPKKIRGLSPWAKYSSVV